ncbi:MAG: hypothetical protein JWN34_587 [Bryobacterales bacterium]|nr:hypothetical protein [Bryobacterales bacterium]
MLWTASAGVGPSGAQLRNEQSCHATLPRLQTRCSLRVVTSLAPGGALILRLSVHGRLEDPFGHHREIGNPPDGIQR